MRVGGLRQLIELDLGNSYRSCLKQLGDAREMSAGTLDRRTQRHHVTAFRLWRMQPRSDECRATTRLEHRDGFLCDVAADGIEDGVAIGNGTREILGVVIDNFIGPEILAHK